MKTIVQDASVYIVFSEQEGENIIKNIEIFREVIDRQHFYDIYVSSANFQPNCFFLVLNPAEIPFLEFLAEDHRKVKVVNKNSPYFEEVFNVIWEKSGGYMASNKDKNLGGVFFMYSDVELIVG